MNPALELVDVHVRLGAVEALRGASLSVMAGEVVGVVGANGAGKTTLIRAALGLAHLQAGEARLAGQEVRGLSEPARARLAGYLPQERRVSWSIPAERLASLGAPDLTPRQALALGREMLGRVGLAGLEARGVLDLSGGERARALIARLFATRAPLLAADEPTAGLDPDAQLMVMDLFRVEAGRGAAALVSLHDLTLAARYCDRIAVLKAGRVVALGPPAEALAPAVLAEAFALDGQLVETAAGPVLAARRG